MAGVDGCRDGWVVALADASTRVRLQTVMCAHFEEVLALPQTPAVIVVDIPIGLLESPEAGGRLCDRAARRLLGPRRNSVFTPPLRRQLAAACYEDVRRDGVSCQAFGLFRKIQEVDAVMTAALQGRVYEGHPELAFQALAGRPLAHAKRRRPGTLERLVALAHARDVQGPGSLEELMQMRRAFTGRRLQPDDLLDASVLAWTALQILRGQAYCIPSDPPRDAKGLTMAIWY
ncbi:DUF429 domain-containing protein [Candidatus Nitrospira bockiana]